jgi:hypothetical protein
MDTSVTWKTKEAGVEFLCCPILVAVTSLVPPFWSLQGNLPRLRVELSLVVAGSRVESLDASLVPFCPAQFIRLGIQ